MSTSPSERLEELLAQALEAHDVGGEAAVRQFLAAHEGDRTALQRGIERCRQMGMLGPGAQRDFPERLGEFRLLRRLGSGGMGVVYEAEQTSLARRVALKVIRTELLYFEGARERFRREIEAVARLSHPAVVPVLASGEQDGVPFYAMELLVGRTVQEVTTAFADEGPASLHGERLGDLLGAGSTASAAMFHGPWWQVCVRVVHAIALGVRHAHVRGIVHRDIKPSNVMVTPHGTAVLLDFGIASIAGGREFTRTGNTPGSPAFMSPEQLRGDAVDERTDVYSLAATLWSMLALAPPFRGVDDLQRIRDGNVPPLAPRYREVPRELEIVLHKAMDRDRERRYADMEAFAADLQAVLLRKPIRARRLGPGLRLLRWSQRHRVAATLAATLLVGAALLPAFVAWRERGVNEELRAAKEQVERSLAESSAARAQAEQSLDATLAALDAVLVRLGATRLRQVPLAQEMAVASLQDAIAVYRRLLPEHPEHEVLRQQAGRAFDSLAAALQRLGRLDEAEAAGHEAIAVLGGDRMDLPPMLLDGRAYAELNLAGVKIEQGDVDGAAPLVAAAERDFAAVAGLPERHASVVRGRAGLAITRMSLPGYRNDPARSEASLREALELTREWMRLRPADLEAKAGEVLRLDDLATFCSQHKRHAEAGALLEEAIAKVRAMPADLATWPPQPQLLAEVLQTLGLLQLAQKDLQSLQTLRECLLLRERAAEEFPGDIEIRSKLGAAVHNLGLVYYRQERDDEALQQFERARDLQRSCLQQKPRDPTARDYLRTTLAQIGMCLRQLGQREALIANAEELAALGDTGALRTAAVQHLRAIQMLDADRVDDVELRQRYARRAMDLLLEAERLGWGRGSRFGEKLYAPLEAFPEFAELKEKVERRRAQLRVDDSSSPASTSSASRESPR